MHRIRGIITVAAALVVLSAAPISQAQDARGRILGRVTDASSAVIPGAEVVATHTEMNTRVTARSNEAGNYDLPYLLPGPYRIDVEAQGFKHYTRQPIEVRVGDAITIDVAMELGNITEHVEVTAEAPLLESASASISSMVDHRQLSDLPIGGGDVMFLSQLAAGVTTAQAPGHNWLPSAVDVMSNLNVAGTPNGSSEFTLDGISNMTRSSVSFAPPPDMVQEFRVQMATFDASLGHAAGGTVNMSLRAGTNELHATADWGNAPNPWQANSFFTNKQIYDLSTGPVTEEKKKRLAPPRMVNRYSATAGGPVYLPKIYDGRNRTFWTYGFQGFNRRNPNNDYFTVPTSAERSGDFSALLALGPNYQIYDPATIAPAAGGRFSRQPLPGNRIPASRLDPLAQKYIQFYPAPNVAGTADGRNNYQVTSANSNDFRQNMVRVDHNMSERHRIFSRYTESWLNFYRGNYFNNEARGLNRYRIQHGAGFDDVYTFSPSFLLNVKYGFTRFLESDYPFSTGYDLSKLGLPASLVSSIDPQGVAFPLVNVDGYASLGEGGGDQFITNYHTWNAAFTKSSGNHTLRWGMEYRLMRENTVSYGNAAPQFDFSTLWTRGPTDTSPTAPIGQGLAALLFGVPTGGSIDLNASRAEQSGFGGLYFQDDWKVTRRLTVNLGLRWEFETSPTERFNRSVRGFDFSTASPISAAALKNYTAKPIPELPVSQFRTMGALTFTGAGGQPRGYYETSKKIFAPRVGWAYQLNARTVLRGGYGIFPDVVGIDRNHANQAGFSQRTNLVPSLDNGQHFRASLANPFPDGVLQPAPVGPATYLGRAISFFPDKYATGYMQRWSFSVQRELPGRSLVEVGYIGNRGTRLNTTRQLDSTPRQYLSTSPERDQAVIDYLGAAVPSPFYGIPEFAGSGITGVNISRGNLLRPYPHFNGMTTPDPSGMSWYHSMVARMEKRFTRGYLMNVNYTWSKYMEAVAYLNDTDPTPTHVISAADRPHRLTVTGIYELPFGKGKPVLSGAGGLLQALFGGWQTQAIYMFQSGPPVGFGNIIFRGDLHDLVLPRYDRSPERWFNIDAGFERSNQKQLGSNIRAFPLRLTGLRADGDNYWNASLHKEFAVRERFKLRLRTEWEGALNHPSFAAPNTAPANTLFGQVNSTRGEARRIFVGLKLMF
ncbi:MAG: carboxypeptidase regulatory-like domain-containing protein [Bryobacteraceae bacterium]